MPGGVIRAPLPVWTRSDHIIAARVSTGAQAQRDSLGVITAQRGGIPRVRLLSGEAFLVSQNGSVTERLREGQVRTVLAQSSGAFPLKQYAAAQPGGQRITPPTDPPSQAAKPEHVWTWHPSHPQDVHGGWQEMKLGVPPVTPLAPDQDLRRGFAWAWKDQWVVAQREYGPGILRTRHRCRAGGRRYDLALRPPNRRDRTRSFTMALYGRGKRSLKNGG
jgi:hypothetical protein